MYREGLKEELKSELTEEFSKREAELKEEAEKAVERSRLEATQTFAKNLLADSELPLETVAKCSGLSLPVVEELAKSVRK